MIRKRLSYLLLGVVAICFTGCKDDSKVPDLDFSRYEKALASANTETDTWIEENLRKPYNIQVIWRYTDIETDMGYNVIPPQERHVRPFLQTLNDVFIKSYVDVYEGNPAYKDSRDFIRTYVPKQIQLLGEWEYQDNGTIRLGVAEGGRKIILSGVNYWREPSRLQRFLHTIFHEFSHIMHQTKLYNIEFEQITKEGYTAQWSNPVDNYSLRMAQAREQGFVSDYARKNRDEDFVETLAYYVMLSPEGWTSFLNSIDGHVKYDEVYESVQKAGLSPDERKEALTDLNNKVITEEELWSRLVDNIWNQLQAFVASGEINANVPDEIADALWGNGLNEEQAEMVYRLLGKNLDQLYDDIRAGAPKIVITYDEVWNAHSDNIMKILNNAVNEGKLDPSIPANISRALKDRKLTPEQVEIIETHAGMSLNDLYYQQSVQLAKENKLTKMQLDEKAERQATAAMHETAAKARDKIKQKQVFISAYLKEKWSIDMDHLRSIVQANYAAVRTRLEASAQVSTAERDAKIIAEGLDEAFRSCTHDESDTETPGHQASHYVEHIDL